MWIPAFTTTQLFLSFWFVPLLSIFVTLVILLASIYDAEIVFNKRIFSRKSKTTLTYRIFKRGKPKITSNEIDRDIQLTRFKTLIFGAIFINRQGKRLLAMHNVR